MKFLPPEGKKEHHISLVSGHTAYIPEEGAELLPIFRKQAIADGCEVAGVDTGELNPNGSTNAPNADERLTLIVNAIDAIVTRGLAEDLTNAGVPKVAVVSKEVGFTVSKEDVEAALAKIAEDDGE